MGGAHPVTDKVLKKVSTYDKISNSWHNYYPDMIKQRFKPGVTKHLDYVIVMGGQVNAAVFDDSIEVMNWKEKSSCKMVSASLPAPMRAVKPTISGGNVVIVGYTSIDFRYTTSYSIPVVSVLSPVDPTVGQTSIHWQQLSHAPHWNTALLPYSNPLVILSGNIDDTNIKYCHV